MTKQPHHDFFELTIQESDFPTALQQTHPPIRQLYGRGDPGLIKKMATQPGLAIVGSRQASAQGLADAQWFAKEASRAGLTIVSGLAQGIDACAHQGALGEAGKTIAVLGHGLQTIYPPQHRDLCDEIISNGGAVITEYPRGTPALPRHFPQRNRLIAGLSRAVLVVEATPKSGSLITARHALELGIDVFVVPGSIHMIQSTGCNALIRQGAQLTQSPQQLLEDLGIETPVPISMGKPPRGASKQYERPWQCTSGRDQKQLSPNSDALTERVLECLGFYPKTVQDLEMQTGITDKTLYGALLVLELCGQASRTPDGKWLKYKQLR
jgi:DNA processing protein